METVSQGQTIEKRITYTTEGNIIRCVGITNLQTAFNIINAAKEKFDRHSSTVILDIDGPVAQTLSEQTGPGLSRTGLESIARHLIENHDISMIFLTSRHLEYGWGTNIQWILTLYELIRNRTTLPETLHSLAYDNLSDLIRKLQSPSPARLIIAGAAKDRATQLLETLLGHRRLRTLVRDISQQSNPNDNRLVPALRAIFNAQQTENTLVAIIDDGAMEEAVRKIAGDYENLQILYIKMENEKIGNLLQLTRGLIGMLAYSLRNVSCRKALEPVNP